MNGSLEPPREAGPPSPTSWVAEVGVPIGALEALDYEVPDGLGELRCGDLVRVPVGSRKLTGYVLSVRAATTGGPGLRAIEGRQEAEPLFTEELVALYRWAAEYYAAPFGEVIRAALPSATREATRATARFAGPCDDPTLKDLHERIRKRPVAVTVLRKEGLGSALDRLVRLGAVGIEQEDGRAATRARTEELFELALDPTLAKRSFEKPGPVRDRLIDWLARFGPATRSEIGDAFPEAQAPLRTLRTKELLRVSSRRVDPLAAERVPARDEDRAARTLTPAQESAFSAVGQGLSSHRFAAYLLRGVTGSGKTEVYLHAAAEVLKGNGTAILLVPEIGLTPQFLGRFRARFGDRMVGVLHSGLAERERVDEWLRIARGEARLVIGARSAIWAPVRDLRLVVVDEEHDHSYKQEEGLRYQARDVAIVRASKAGACVVLGSATPSLESVRNAQDGRFRRLDLPDRVQARPMPAVEIVDLKLFPPTDPEAPEAALSPTLRQALVDNHDAGGQAILLLNRRGFATTVICTSCAAQFRCGRCDLGLTYHGRRHSLICHGCGHSEPLPERCPACEHPGAFKLVGRGTERIEEELLQVLPSLRFDRMDADTTRSRAAHRRILDRFRGGGIDVLIGTQMVAKGHDFPGVTLVGVLHADAALHLPDFRASERTFQLVAQVAGRAGRGERPGRVIVQSHHPDHHAIRLALAHDWEAFVERELPLRRGLFYPPYARLVLLRCSATEERRAMECAARARTAAAESIQVLDDPRTARVLGPAPAPLFRLQGRFRFQVMIKARDHGAMTRIVGQLRGRLAAATAATGGDARIVLDRDPATMM